MRSFNQQGLGMNLWAKMFILVFLIFYFVVIWHFSVNVPAIDDYLALLRDLLNLLNASSCKSFIHYLFVQHNEHRIMTTRLVEYGQYLLLGHVNFKGLILFANLSFVGIFFLIYFAMARTSQIFTCLLLLFILQLTYWDVAFGAMMGLSTGLVFVFSFLSLFCLWQECDSEDLKSYGFFLIACVSAFFATFSNGNGMLVFIPGLIMLLWYREWWRLLFYFGFALICIFFYFYGYTTPTQPEFNFSAFVYSITFLGGVVHSHKLSFLMGLFGLIIFFYLSVQDQKTGRLRSRLFFYYVFYLLLTAAVTGPSRVHITTEAAFTSRYTIYSVVYFACLAAWYVSWYGRIKGWGILMLVSFLINFPQAIHNERQRIIVLESYQLQADGTITGLYTSNLPRANQILKEAAAQKIYYLPGLKNYP